MNATLNKLTIKVIPLRYNLQVCTPTGKPIYHLIFGYHPWN